MQLRHDPLSRCRDDDTDSDGRQNRGKRIKIDLPLPDDAVHRLSDENRHIQRQSDADEAQHKGKHQQRHMRLDIAQNAAQDNALRGDGRLFLILSHVACPPPS